MDPITMGLIMGGMGALGGLFGSDNKQTQQTSQTQRIDPFGGPDRFNFILDEAMRLYQNRTPWQPSYAMGMWDQIAPGGFQLPQFQPLPPPAPAPPQYVWQGALGGLPTHRGLIPV